MTIHDIVKKLVGPIDPIAESNSDDQRFENLKKMTELVDMLIFDINYVARGKESQQYSVSRAGKHSKEFLTNLKEEL